MVFAYEVDNFTNRYRPLHDSQDGLDKKMNEMMSKVHENLGNQDALNARTSRGVQKKTCDKVKFAKAAHGYLSSAVIGGMETFANKEKTVSVHAPHADSIYAEAEDTGTILDLAGINSSVNVNGNYIGTDKLNHFIDQGFGMWLTYKKKGDPAKGLQAALNKSESSENQYFGLQTTGIKSYGDLSANYSGMKFWLSLTDGPQPYFKCEDDKWTQVREFRWAEYVDASWDEAINCSVFDTDNFKKSVDKHQAMLEERAKRNGREQRFKCPVSTQECEKLTKLRGKNAAQLLGPGCLDAKANPEEGKYSAQVPFSKNPVSSTTSSSPLITPEGQN